VYFPSGEVEVSITLTFVGSEVTVMVGAADVGGLTHRSGAVTKFPWSRESDVEPETAARTMEH